MLLGANHGFKTFSFVWFGQLISIIGSGLTGFALGVWVYLQTGSVTDFALIALSASLPGILVSPFAGVIVDRYDRRWVMILSDIGAGLSTLAIFFLLLTNQLEIWHIYVATSIASICNSFQWPAYQATVSLLVPKKHLGRANGMIQMSEAASIVIAPILAGLLISKIDIHGIIIIDFITFLFATVSLFLVRFPQIEKKTIDEKEEKSFLKEATFGWKYIMARPGLRGLLVFFTAGNFLLGFMNVTLAPLILSFSTEEVLGYVVSASGIGMVLGGLTMSIWGGPKQRVKTLLSLGFLSSVCIAIAGLKASAILIGICLFISMFTLPIANGASQSIWQSKVAPEVQGRVFALRRMIAVSLSPIAFLLSGPLVDKVFEPTMADNGLLASSIGSFIGTGNGRGIGLLFICIGFLWALTAISCYVNPRVRHVEKELPDCLVQKGEGLEEKSEIATGEAAASHI